MPRRLLDEIESDALSDGVPLATALRKCIALGGQSGSEKLRDWASRELNGYADEELPEYRKLPAPLKIDAMTAGAQITGQQIGPHALPEPANKFIREEVELRFGVGEVEALVASRPAGESIKLQPAGSTQIVALMNHEINEPFQQITALYWSVAPAAIRGVLDRIRTSLTVLVAEIRAATPGDPQTPPTEAADQAVQVVLTGKRSKANVTVTQASGQATATTTTNAATDHSTATVQTSEEAGWTTRRKVFAAIGGIATIAGTVFGGIQAF